MRLLIVTQYFWPENFSINEIAKKLSEKGVEVEVLTGKPNYPEGKLFSGYRLWGCQYEIHHGIAINRIPLLARGRGGLRLALNYLSFVVFGILYAPGLLRRKKFDVIFIYAPSPILQAIPAIFLAWLKDCPAVLWVQDLWPESLAATGYIRNRIVLQLVRPMVSFIYRHVDLLLVQSEAFIQPVKALALTTSIKYYPNSVQESFTTPNITAIPDIPELDRGFTLMFAGNIGTAQAVEVIVEAAILLKGYADIQFIMVGDGSRREWMWQEVNHRGLKNIHLPGKFPMEAMPGFMQRASVLLVTLADREIFKATVPSKVQAYLAAGRPILASLEGEGAKLIHASGAGVTVPAEDGAALAEAVLRMYYMPSYEREAMGVKGRAYYTQHFSQDMLVNKLIDHLQSTFKRH